jgi:hypothetical protein
MTLNTRDRWNFQIRDTEPDDTAMARRIAGRLVDSSPWTRTYRPFVIDSVVAPTHDASGRPNRSRDKAIPPGDLEWTRKRKNTFGISIGKKEPNARTRAIDWTADALLKGYTVCVGWGGHHLKGGDYAEDIWDFQDRQKVVA